MEGRCGDDFRERLLGPCNEGVMERNVVHAALANARPRGAAAADQGSKPLEPAAASATPTPSSHAPRAQRLRCQVHAQDVTKIHWMKSVKYFSAVVPHVALALPRDGKGHGQWRGACQT